jgi:hypothetical protein
MDEGVLPPGQHRSDPLKQDIDPIGFALERIQTFLVWIEEHRASFEKCRDTDPASAERELRYLEDSTDQALTHLQRLKELLLTGYSIDPNKRLPKGLNDPNTMRVILAMIKRHLEP